nr:rho GTPase-activating protein 20-like [Microcebus murinus]
MPMLHQPQPRSWDSSSESCSCSSVGMAACRALCCLSGQLPEVNVVLWRHLFGVLYNVEKRSSSNLMTAYNLAVCVAPNVPWPADPCSSESRDALAEKVSLVQFLIERSLRIFGEDIACLLGSSPVSCDDRETTSVKAEQPLEGSETSETVGATVILERHTRA